MAQIDAAQRRLSDLKTKADELQIREKHLLFELAEVRTSQRRTRAELARAANSNTSIARLPDEVLAEIFSHLEGGWYNPLPFLVDASHVISRWRTVALSTPALWSKIQLYPINGFYQLITEYIARSGTRVLDIFVYICSEGEDYVATVVKLLLPQISRWHRLVIESEDEKALRALLQPLRHLSAPCLEHLQIDLEIEDEQSDRLWVNNNHTLDGGVPVLSYVGLRGINMLHWLPPLTGVKSIYMADCYSATMLNFKEFRSILAAAATSLNHLELEGMINCLADDDVTIIEMPSLVSLTVLPPDYVNPTHYIRNTFTTISAPSLETLCLRKVYGLQFGAFLESFRGANWHPVLQTLRLESVTGLEHLTPAFALSSPTITHLSLKFTDPEPILSFLTRDGHDPLWPRLQTLSVGPVDRALLRSFISRRIAVGRPLVTLRYGTQSRAASVEDLPTNEWDWFRERLKVENVSFHDI